MGRKGLIVDAAAADDVSRPPWSKTWHSLSDGLVFETSKLRGRRPTTPLPRLMGVPYHRMVLASLLQVH